jgi:hypothetical protein
MTLFLSAETIARTLGGRKYAGGWIARCPAHDDHNPSLSISEKNGKVLVKCHTGCEQERVIAALKARSLWHGSGERRALPKPAISRPVKGSAASIIWPRLWARAKDPRGTLAERYLRGRGLDLPDCAVGEAIRFDPHCQFGTGAEAKHYSTMLCLARGIIDNCAQAVHRTALADDGTAIKRDGKTLRMSLGIVKGGAIKLTPDEDVAYCLGIAEGVETALSMQKDERFGRSPVWSVINDGGIAEFPVLAGIETLWIAVDADDAGRKAAQKATDRWTAAGREVFQLEKGATDGR